MGSAFLPAQVNREVGNALKDKVVGGWNARLNSGTGVGREIADRVAAAVVARGGPAATAEKTVPQ